MMDTRGRLVAGSHNRNEFVLINADENGKVRSQECFIFFFNSFFFFFNFWNTHLHFLFVQIWGLLEM